MRALGLGGSQEAAQILQKACRSVCKRASMAPASAKAEMKGG